MALVEPAQLGVHLVPSALELECPCETSQLVLLMLTTLVPWSGVARQLLDAWRVQLMLSTCAPWSGVVRQLFGGAFDANHFGA